MENLEYMLKIILTKYLESQNLYTEHRNRFLNKKYWILVRQESNW